MQPSIVFHRGSGNIDVDPADRAIFMLRGINRLYGVEHIFNRIVDRMFSAFDRQPLVSHILKGPYLSGYFFP